MSEDNAGGKYRERKSRIRAELEAYEGEGPPTNDQLWSIARYESRGAADWIDDMPPDADPVEVAKVDVLEALVALEMLEERLLSADGDTDA